ncbi:hypothetical protein MNBD_GAMMA06-1606 [hydrothermal vent metagenome]|uniref:DUF3570 domain-containing protein n=1 Tax=hydrothermal vent metagenome TaxID=652676 RepID=A0A3B0W4V4_9ZZZZ
MQLKNLKGKVSLAACALLQVGTSSSQAGEWDVDSSFLYYSEGDGRVSAFEPAVRVAADLGDDEYINFQVVVDALTGATPNGAHKSTTEVQTFTNPSGNGSYTVQPGELPLSSTFRDTRVAVTAEWDKPINRLSSILLGASVSSEFDYTSLGVSSTYEHEFNNKNTTLAAGAALTFDTITPVGSVPLGLNPMRRAGSDQQRQGGNDTKTNADFIIGVTQILSRTSLIQLNFTHGVSSGYLNDYNNILTVVNPDGKLTTAGWAAGDNLPYLFENRPDSRSKNIIFLRGVHHLTEDVINFSYRYFSDDWGINSHTFDFRYRYQLTSKQYVQPHVRYYTQTKADFYRHDLVQGVDVDNSGAANVQYASSDYRVGAFDSMTYGLSYGLKLSKNSEFTIRGELMQQAIDNSEVPRVGEETPDLTAVIFQAGYSFVW